MKIRRTDWDGLLTSRAAGDRQGNYRFTYDYDGPWLLDYYRLPDAIEDGDAVTDEERALGVELDELLKRATGGVTDPFVELSEPDFEHLCELTRIADKALGSRLIDYLEPTGTDTHVSLTKRDFEDLCELAADAVDGMPSDEPKRLDYRAVIEGVRKS